MNHTFDVGDLVVAVKDLRNDGTYPDPEIGVGAVLVPDGTRGEVLNVGLYLQEHIVYAIAFANGRVVGCLERELAAPSTTTAPAAAAAGPKSPEKGEPS